MKIICMALLIFACTAVSMAQGVFSNATNATLSKVIEDYPNSFRNIRGELIVHKAGSADFKSKVELPGSLYCNIKQYITGRHQLYSWNCIAFQSGTFRQSSEKFSQLYRQISNTIIKVDGMKPFILNGAFEQPAEDKNMTTINFQLVPSVGEMKKLQIELSLRQESGKWSVYLSVGEEISTDLTAVREE